MHIRSKAKLEEARTVSAAAVEKTRRVADQLKLEQARLAELEGTLLDAVAQKRAAEAELLDERARAVAGEALEAEARHAAAVAARKHAAEMELWCCL